jgi:hypothetical protein
MPSTRCAGRRRRGRRRRCPAAKGSVTSTGHGQSRCRHSRRREAQTHTLRGTRQATQPANTHAPSVPPRLAPIADSERPTSGPAHHHDRASPKLRGKSQLSRDTALSDMSSASMRPAQCHLLLGGFAPGWSYSRVSSAKCRQPCRFGRKWAHREHQKVPICRTEVGGGDRSRTGDGGLAVVSRRAGG